MKPTKTLHELILVNHFIRVVIVLQIHKAIFYLLVADNHQEMR